MLYRKVLDLNQNIKSEKTHAQLRVFISKYNTTTGQIGRLIGKLRNSFSGFLPRDYKLAYFDYSKMEFRKGLNSITLDTSGLKAVIVDDSVDLVKHTIKEYNKIYSPKLLPETEKEIPLVLQQELNATLQKLADNLEKKIPSLLNERKSRRKFETRFINASSFFQLEICSNYVDCLRIRNAFIKDWLNKNSKRYNFCYTQLHDVFFIAVDDDLSLKLGTEKSASLNK